MNTFLKIGLISSFCNSLATLSKELINKKGDFTELTNLFTTRDGAISFLTKTGTSFLVSTAPAIVGYLGSNLVNNGFGKQTISVIPALALTAAAECFTEDGILKLTPTLGNFELFNDYQDFTLSKFTDSTEIHPMKYEVIDFFNTVLQLELLESLC